MASSSVQLGSHCIQGGVVTLEGLKKQSPAEIRMLPKKETTAVASDPVKVSLRDCLACSGCITTAETLSQA